MPIYEYRCGSCGQVSSFFTRSIGSPLEPICSHCESPDMQRRMSSFAMGKTTQSVHDSFPSISGAVMQQMVAYNALQQRYLDSLAERHA